MKQIVLTLGKIALVDDEDYDDLIGYVWHTIPSRSTFYASRSGRSSRVEGIRIYYEPSSVAMHRQVLNSPNGIVDHIDGNGLNNQKSNLRVVDSKQNQWNARKHSDGCSSKYKGVHASRNGKWKATFGSPERIHLGTFESETEAALAYNFAARKSFGEFALLNEVHL